MCILLGWYLLKPTTEIKKVSPSLKWMLWHLVYHIACLVTSWSSVLIKWTPWLFKPLVSFSIIIAVAHLTHVIFSLHLSPPFISLSPALLDDLDKELNNYAMRLREWYGWHFPELNKIVTDNLTYARTVKALGMLCFLNILVTLIACHLLWTTMFQDTDMQLSIICTFNPLQLAPVIR